MGGLVGLVGRLIFGHMSNMVYAVNAIQPPPECYEPFWARSNVMMQEIEPFVVDDFEFRCSFRTSGSTSFTVYHRTAGNAATQKAGLMSITPAKTTQLRYE